MVLKDLEVVKRKIRKQRGVTAKSRERSDLARKGNCQSPKTRKVEENPIGKSLEMRGNYLNLVFEKM